LGLTKYE